MQKKIKAYKATLGLTLDDAAADAGRKETEDHDDGCSRARRSFLKVAVERVTTVLDYLER